MRKISTAFSDQSCEIKGREASVSLTLLVGLTKKSRAGPRERI